MFFVCTPSQGGIIHPYSDTSINVFLFFYLTLLIDLGQLAIYVLY